MSRARTGWLMPLSFIVALLLGLLPLPDPHPNPSLPRGLPSVAAGRGA